MREPLRIAFPVIPECGQYSMHFRGPAILLQCEPIEAAHPLRNPNPQCHVIGQLQNGRQVQFTIPLSAWRAALQTPVMFLSVTQPNNARAGVLFDANGAPLKGTMIPSTGVDSAIHTKH